jgi:hypothetical protein
MYEKASNAAFVNRRSQAPRPLSEATEIFDTDLELSEDENDSRRLSVQSVGNAQSSLSSCSVLRSSTVWQE